MAWFSHICEMTSNLAMRKYARLLISTINMMEFIRFTASSRRAVLNLGSNSTHCTICTIWSLLSFEIWAVNICYTCGMPLGIRSSDSITGSGRMGRSD